MYSDSMMSDTNDESIITESFDVISLQSLRHNAQVEELTADEVEEPTVVDAPGPPRDQYPTPVGDIKALLLAISGFTHEAFHASGG